MGVSVITNLHVLLYYRFIVRFRYLGLPLVFVVDPPLLRVAMGGGGSDNPRS